MAIKLISIVASITNWEYVKYAVNPADLLIRAQACA